MATLKSYLELQERLNQIQMPAAMQAIENASKIESVLLKSSRLFENMALTALYKNSALVEAIQRQDQLIQNPAWIDALERQSQLIERFHGISEVMASGCFSHLIQPANFINSPSCLKAIDAARYAAPIMETIYKNRGLLNDYFSYEDSVEIISDLESALSVEPVRAARKLLDADPNISVSDFRERFTESLGLTALDEISQQQFLSKMLAFFLWLMPIVLTLAIYYDSRISSNEHSEETREMKKEIGEMKSAISELTEALQQSLGELQQLRGQEPPGS